SGVQPYNGQLAWIDPTILLEDGDYRYYWRQGQLVNGAPHWSDWQNNGTFTVDAPKPGVPSMTLVPESEAGRIRIELEETSGDAATDHFRVQVSNDNATWVDLRTPGGEGKVTPGGGEATAWDFEAPNGRPRFIRARAVSAAGSRSDWATDTATWQSRRMWLKHPTNPD